MQKKLHPVGEWSIVRVTFLFNVWILHQCFWRSNKNFRDGRQREAEEFFKLLKSIQWNAMCWHGRILGVSWQLVREWRHSEPAAGHLTRTHHWQGCPAPVTDLTSPRRCCSWWYRGWRRDCRWDVLWRWWHSLSAVWWRNASASASHQVLSTLQRVLLHNLPQRRLRTNSNPNISSIEQLLTDRFIALSRRTQPTCETAQSITFQYSFVWRLLKH